LEEPSNSLTPQQEFISNNGIFTEKVKDKVDELARLYGHLLRRQSYREFHRAYFQLGITRKSKTNAHRSVILLTLIILVSRYGQQMLDEAFNVKAAEIDKGG
jgi:hypothetical protein